MKLKHLPQLQKRKLMTKRKPDQLRMKKAKMKNHQKKNHLETMMMMLNQLNQLKIKILKNVMLQIQQRERKIQNINHQCKRPKKKKMLLPLPRRKEQMLNLKPN